MIHLAHLTALALTLGIYLALAIAYLGWGEIVQWIFRLNLSDSDDRLPITGRLWLGWVITLTLLQAIHFFYPIDVRCVIPVLAVGMVAAIANMKKWRPSRSPAMLAVGLLLLIASLWIASRSMLRPWNYDSGLYHFQAIRWINEYPLVPGLGNLHGRLAFNQSFFTYAAAVNFHPWFGHGRSIANSFLWLLTLATLIDLARGMSLSEREKEAGLAARVAGISGEILGGGGIFAALIVGILIAIGLESDGLGSPTPDLASTLLQLVMMTLLIQSSLRWQAGIRLQKSRAIWLSLLAVTAITIKLSNLMFAGTMLLIVLVYLCKTRCGRLAFGLGFLWLSMIAVWWCRGIGLSGAPLYPSTLGYWPTDWAMPKERIIQEMHVTLAWARSPEADWTQVIASNAWIKPWLGRMLQETRLVVLPLAITLIAGSAALVLAIRRPAARLKPVQMIWAIPLLASLGYWFFTAPDWRFAHAVFFLLPLVSLWWMLIACRALLSESAYRRLAILCLVGWGLLWILPAAKNVTSISIAGWYPIPIVSMQKLVTRSGLEVGWPSSGNQAWDASLPNTPYFDPDLKLRGSATNPTDLSQGFPP